MASVNKVTILGKCGSDIELRQTSLKQSIASCSVATNSYKKNKENGESLQETQWHRVVFFDRLAEIAAEHLKKGADVYLEGRLRYGKYIDKEGVERNTTDILVTDMQLLKNVAAQSKEKQTSVLPKKNDSLDGLDDDIPF